MNLIPIVVKPGKTVLGTTYYHDARLDVSPNLAKHLVAEGVAWLAAASYSFDVIYCGPSKVDKKCRTIVDGFVTPEDAEVELRAMFDHVTVKEVKLFAALDELRRIVLRY